MLTATCCAQNRQGQPCKAAPLHGKALCAVHDPEHPFASHKHAVVAGRLGGRVPRLSLRKLPSDVVEALREAGPCPCSARTGTPAPARSRTTRRSCGSSPMPYKDPERQRAAKAEHARRRRAAGVEPGRGTLGPLLPGALRVKTARDVLAVLEQQTSAVLADEELRTAERARVIATLCGVSLRAIEAGDLAARLEALERHLRGRTA
jgi:hypothetical protein